MLARIFPATRMNRVPARGMTPTSALLLGAMSILMVFDTAVQSRIGIFLFGDASFGTSLMVCFCVIIFFAGVALLQRDMFILALFAAIIVFFLSYYLYFLVGANRPLNFNTLGSYYGALTVIVFYVLAKYELLPVAMKFLFYIHGAYLLMYLALANGVGVSPSIVSQKFVLVYTERGSRLFMQSAAASYVVMYSVAKLQEKFRLQYFATLALAGYALYLSQSRGLIICLGGIVALYLITRRMTFVQYFSFIAYLLVALYLSVGVFQPSFDPYSFTKSDVSAIARSYEYLIVVPYIRNYPVFGVGLPDSLSGLTQYLGAVVNTDDVGIIGIWFTYGLFGVSVIGITATYLSCMQNIKRSSAVLGLANARALSLTGCVISLYAVMANNLLSDSALEFSLIFANTLYNSSLFAATKQTSRPVFARRQSRRLQSGPMQRPPAVEPN